MTDVLAELETELKWHKDEIIQSYESKYMKQYNMRMQLIFQKHLLRNIEWDYWEKCN